MTTVWDEVASQTVVGVAGDWHGHYGCAAARIRETARAGARICISCGDAGLWPGRSGAKFLRKLEAVCQRYGVHLLVVPGNHDHLSRRSEARAARAASRQDEREPLRLTPHVTALPTGHRWTMGERSFVAVGGAPSLDFESRTEGVDWWERECISEEEAVRVAEAGHAEVMISHDSPGDPYWTPPVARIVTTNPTGWSEAALEYATVGRRRLTTAFLGVRPRLLGHGHFHVSGETRVRYEDTGGEVHIVSLPADGQAGNLQFIDLATLAVTSHPGDADGPA